MVGSGVAVKKLWKSLRASVTVRGRGMKRKLASMNILKKKKRVVRNGHIHSIPPSKWHNGRYDHYNYSDDDEVDGRFRKKLRNWNIKTMSCFFGSVDIEPVNEQYVYVTDLYGSKSQTFKSHEEADFKTDKMKGEKDAIASGSGGSPADGNKNDQFVYVTDLYASRSQTFNSHEEADFKTDKMKGQKDAIASGSGGSPTDGNENEKSRSSAMQEFNMKAFLSAAATVETSPSTDAKRKKTVCWSTAQAELNCEEKKRISVFADAEKVDTDAEVFIAKFYDDMKLQKQKSIVEYRAMLDRGAM